MSDKKEVIFLNMRKPLRKDEGDPNHNMDVIFVYFEETTQSFQEGLPFIQFLAAVGMGRQLWYDSQQIEDQIIGGGEHLNQASPWFKTITV